MQITILALGTRGDVQPYIALGLRLQAEGHKIKLATLDIFKHFILSKGLDFVSLGSVPQESKAPNQKKEEGNNGIRFHGISGRIDWWQLFNKSFLEIVIRKSWEACQKSEAIIGSRLALPGYHISEKIGIPYFAAYTNPLTPTRTFPSPLLTSNFNLDSTLNYSTHTAEEQLCWRFTGKTINQWRTEFLNLEPIPFPGIYSRQSKEEIPTLHCYSPNVLPKPSDWQDWTYVTGYWFLDRPINWQPPQELVNFIQAGSPPVYIGFGSMSDPNPEALTKLVLDALAQSGERGILLQGWGALTNADLPDTVYKIDSIPHDWLFPKMSAVVHHGGGWYDLCGVAGWYSFYYYSFCCRSAFLGAKSS